MRHWFVPLEHPVLCLILSHFGHVRNAVLVSDLSDLAHRDGTRKSAYAVCHLCHFLPKCYMPRQCNICNILGVALGMLHSGSLENTHIFGLGWPPHRRGVISQMLHIVLHLVHVAFTLNPRATSRLQKPLFQESPERLIKKRFPTEDHRPLVRKFEGPLCLV